MTQPDTVEYRGFLWPAEDTACRRAAFDLAGLEVACHFVTDWRVAVQAGGNAGVWPRALGHRFGVVYTFEPDPLNFRCLVANVTEPNVVKLQAALGPPDTAPMGMIGATSNSGALQMSGAGGLPVLALDALNLPACGLLYLDIEGMEPYALAGAAATIQRCRPVIGLENKGLSRKYTAPQVRQLVLDMGYQYVGTVGRDEVFKPC